MIFYDYDIQDDIDVSLSIILLRYNNSSICIYFYPRNIFHPEETRDRTFSTSFY